MAPSLRKFYLHGMLQDTVKQWPRFAKPWTTKGSPEGLFTVLARRACCWRRGPHRFVDTGTSLYFFRWLGVSVGVGFTDRKCWSFRAHPLPRTRFQTPRILKPEFLQEHPIRKALAAPRFGRILLHQACWRCLWQQLYCMDRASGCQKPTD